MSFLFRFLLFLLFCMVRVLFWSESDERESGVMGNRPEERKRRVKAALLGAGFEAEQIAVPEPSLEFASEVHTPEMLAFLERAWGEWEKLWLGERRREKREERMRE